MPAFRPILALVACAVLLGAPPFTEVADAQSRGDRRERAGRAVFPPHAGGFVPIMQRGGQEPAYARGYADGYRRGRADAREGNRYDPANSREYRDGDQGYSNSYGSRDGYRTNYRAGFRKGYDDGYRSGTR